MATWQAAYTQKAMPGVGKVLDRLANLSVYLNEFFGCIDAMSASIDPKTAPLKSKKWSELVQKAHDHLFGNGEGGEQAKEGTQAGHGKPKPDQWQMLECLRDSGLHDLCSRARDVS
jgi:hypothetical protein